MYSKLKYDRFVKFTNKLEDIMLAYIPVGLAILICVGVFSRTTNVYLGLYWLEEFSRVMLIFIVFLGSSVAVKAQAHPNMDAIYKLLPQRIQHALWTIVYAVCFIAFIYLDFFVWKHIGKIARLGVKTSTLGNAPLYLTYLPIAVFTFFMAIRYLLEARNEWKAVWKVENASMTGEGGEL